MSQTSPPKWFADAMAVPLQRRTLTVAECPLNYFVWGDLCEAADRARARRRRARDVVERRSHRSFHSTTTSSRRT